MFRDKKLRDLVSMTTMVSLTNLRMLVQKDICTNEEWQLESAKIINVIQENHTKGGTAEDLVRALQDMVDEEDVVNTKAKKIEAKDE